MERIIDRLEKDSYNTLNGSKLTVVPNKAKNRQKNHVSAFVDPVPNNKRKRNQISAFRDSEDSGVTFRRNIFDTIS